LSLRRASWSLDNKYFSGVGTHQRQVIGGDLLDTRVLGPCALLDLQLTPFDVQLVALLRKLLEFDKRAIALSTQTTANTRTSKDD
jgi:hypothetical protein